MSDLVQVCLNLLLSVQRALLGTVPAALRQVICSWEGTELKLRFVFDGEICLDDREGLSIAGTEVVAVFAEPWTISEEFVRIDYPINLRKSWPTANMFMAYERKERSTERVRLWPKRGQDNEKQPWHWALQMVPTCPNVSFVHGKPLRGVGKAFASL